MAQPCFCNLQIRFSAGKNPYEFVHLLGRVLMPSGRNWDQQLTTFTGYCYGKYFGSFSYTNISDTEGFFTLLKALGRFSLYHPPNWPWIVQWELWIFSIKADPTHTCGSRHHIQQDTPYLSIHPTLRHLTLFSDIPNNSNWKSAPILTAYPHQAEADTGYPRALLPEPCLPKLFWYTCLNSRSAQDSWFFPYLYSSSCSSLASWSFNLNSSAVTLPFPSRSWLANIFLTIFSKSKPGASFPLPVSTWVWMYSEN